MTREEAISELVRHKQEAQNDFGWNTTLQSAFEMAIAALKAEPCDTLKLDGMLEDAYEHGYEQARHDFEVQPCEDCVSRADTLQSFESYCENNCQYSKKQRDVMCGACMMGDAIEIVENLPPVTPKSLDSMLDKVRAEIEEMKLDEAIKCIEEMVEIGETYEVGKVVEENIQLAEWLKELKQLREQYRWIPVSERLPEDGRPVLIYAWNVHHVIARYDEFRTANGYKKTWVTADAWNGNTKIKHKVIAWMPLPEPYREGESE